MQVLAQKLGLTVSQLNRQIIESAYANAWMENPNITIELVKEAAKLKGLAASL